MLISDRTSIFTDARMSTFDPAEAQGSEEQDAPIPHLLVLLLILLALTMTVLAFHPLR